MKNGMVLWMVGDSVLFPGGNKEASVARRIAGAPGLGHKCRSIQVFASPGITSADGRAVFRDLILPNLTRGDSLVVSLGLNDAVRRTRTPHLKRRVWLRWKKLDPGRKLSRVVASQPCTIRSGRKPRSMRSPTSAS